MPPLEEIKKEDLKLDKEAIKETLEHESEDESQEIDDIINESIDEIQAQEENIQVSEEIIKEYEEMEQTKPDQEPYCITKEDYNKLYEKLNYIDEHILKVNRNVDTRNAEYINFLKLIFDRLKFLKGRIGKWFVISSIILVIGGGVTFTTIFYHWDKLEPKIDKILGVAKVANNVAKLGSN